ncbi:hypothetical protein [Streptomonospora sediminis]
MKGTEHMPTRTSALAGTALAVLAVLTAGAPPAAAAGGGSGTLETYAGPGIGYRQLQVADGCHNYERPRTVGFADADPIATYYFYAGRDCTGAALGTGRDDTQWIPPLNGVNSVHIDFE